MVCAAAPQAAQKDGPASHVSHHPVASRSNQDTPRIDEFLPMKLPERFLHLAYSHGIGVILIDGMHRIAATFESD
jgi:hypothetical protein